MKKTGWSRFAAMVVILSGMVFTFVLVATAADHPIEQRLTNQQKRIDDGVKSKQLTQAEAKILRDNLNYVKQEEARLKADGKLNDKERERLDKLIDQNGDMIRDKKANPVKAMAPAPAAPAVPAKPAAVSTVPAKPAPVSTAPVPGAAKVEERFERQEKRIADGVKSGKLTPAEASALRDNLSYIKAEETRLKADGKLDSTERQRLDKMLDRNSNMIENKKDNPVKVLKDSHLQNRLENQQERIDKAVISGTLTKDEAKVVQDNLNKIKAEEARLTKEKKLTTEDKTRLDKMIDQNNDMIQDKKKNPVKKL
jgi:polyhydroxyalkanoate synthesis regulator phasin